MTDEPTGQTTSPSDSSPSQTAAARPLGRAGAAERRRGVARGLAGLVLIMLIVAVPWSWIAYRAEGLTGLMSVVLPAACCTLAAGTALLLTAWGAQQASLGPLFGSIMARTMFPMAICYLMLQSASPIVQHGLLGKFLAFYLLSLAAETVLATRLLQKPRSTALGHA